ncbi:serine carboxypeptidase-like 50 [Salvia divinorum]|uniref:Carboxypeptidase n=1 Tax=Salvia divinorum TaxID=28513 RepID=A0ABD1GVK2_SALDI
MASPPPLLLLLLLLLISSASAISYPKEALPTKSGYLTVNSTTGSAIFYTYYESQSPPKNTPISQTPILIWLQGGPGCSSMLANYFELGPWLVNQEVKLESNPNSWNKQFGLLFLDNPIGTGFSIAATPDEIPRDQNSVASHLFVALKKFISLDKSFKTRPIYLTGESYAGKYLPALGYYILKKNAISSYGERINVAGIAIGNGLTDPEIQVQDHAITAFHLGLINEKQKAHLEKLQLKTVAFIKRRKWSDASDTRADVLDTLTNMSGLATLYDVRKLAPYPNNVVVSFLNDAEVKRALHVPGDITFAKCSSVVADAMHEDIMKSVRPMVEWLVTRTRVLLYQGQTDLRDGPTSTSSWVREMRWEGIEGFLGAEREVWRVGGLLAGYVQRWERFSNAVVLNAGHLVPTDQPLNSQIMIQDWVLEKGLFGGGRKD